MATSGNWTTRTNDFKKKKCLWPKRLSGSASDVAGTLGLSKKVTVSRHYEPFDRASIELASPGSDRRVEMLKTGQSEVILPLPAKNLGIATHLAMTENEIFWKALPKTLKSSDLSK